MTAEIKGNKEKKFDPRTLEVLKGKKVLVVDDLLDNRLLEILFLKKAGVLVEQACNGIEAVAKALVQHFDAILMDLHMPELDGLGATARLRKEGFINPIIAVTANGQQNVREIAFSVGVDDYISKPLSNRELLESLARHCTEMEPNPDPEEDRPKDLH